MNSIEFIVHADITALKDVEKSSKFCRKYGILKLWGIIHPRKQVPVLLDITKVYAPYE